MKNLIILIVIILVIIVGGYYLFGNFSEENKNPAASGRFCDWIYKTKGDYSNLIGVIFDSEKNQIGAYPLFHKKAEKVDNDYYKTSYICPHPGKVNIAFTSITWNDWKNSQENCRQQIEDKHNQLKIKKCGSLNFDIFEERTDPDSGEISVSDLPPRDVVNPTRCTYSISAKESKWANSCEPQLSADDFARNILDEDPFIELYLCSRVLTETSKEALESECEKKI